jgi:hypothetical protein
MSVMAAVEKGTGYKVWGADDVVYGPVELPDLVSWVKDERVTGATWIYSEASDSWHKADHLPELQLFFRKKTAGGSAPMAHPDTALQIKPGSLRRVKIFAELNDQQLETLANFVELRSIRQWTEVVRQGDPGDSMFLIMDGEVRVRLMINGRESTLVTLGAGELFGEMSFFDDAPRSADVIANKDTVLLKMKTEGFRQLAQEHPALATPILLAIARTLAARIRADDKRYRDSVAFARASGGPA